MPGLDTGVLDQLDIDLALRRIKTDVTSDFILSPHYSAVFENVGDDLWDQISTELRDGRFEAALPIEIEVPKPNGITRPGTILPPADRILYQALVDFVSEIGEAQLDRTRTFSHVLVSPDPEGRMFEPGRRSWDRLKEAVTEACEDPTIEWAIRADISAYFERIYQHNLVNLLTSSGCEPGAVNLLEKLLSAWREKDSHGILQGMFPSDFLGNFALLGLDSAFEVDGIRSARYVDDLFLFFPTRRNAREGLVRLCQALRREGLHLNERKSDIVESELLLHEETRVDQLFEEAWEEVEGEAFGLIAVGFYGFETPWMDEEEPPDEEELELMSVERLYDQLEEPDAPSDRIERFCLPLLAAAGSDIAVDRALSGFIDRPHLAKTYASYLARIGRDHPELVERLEALFQENDFSYDWQHHWVAGALLFQEDVSGPTLTTALRILKAPAFSPALRAVCAALVGKHGDAGKRRQLRTHYSAEASPYVRSAILFASRYFPTAERRTCLGAWGGHSSENALVASAVRKLVSVS